MTTPPTYRLDVQTTQGRALLDKEYESVALARNSANALIQLMGASNTPCWVDIIGPTGIVETVSPKPKE